MPSRSSSVNGSPRPWCPDRPPPGPHVTITPEQQLARDLLPLIERASALLGATERKNRERFGDEEAAEHKRVFNHLADAHDLLWKLAQCIEREDGIPTADGCNRAGRPASYRVTVVDGAQTIKGHTVENIVNVDKRTCTVTHHPNRDRLAHRAFQAGQVAAQVDADRR